MTGWLANSVDAIRERMQRRESLLAQSARVFGEHTASWTPGSSWEPTESTDRWRCEFRGCVRDLTGRCAYCGDIAEEGA